MEAVPFSRDDVKVTCRIICKITGIIPTSKHDETSLARSLFQSRKRIEAFGGLLALP